LEISASFAAGNTAFNVELSDNGASTTEYTVTVTGLDLSGATITDSLITIV